MSEDRLTIEVDGVELEARPGQMLMEVTDAAGIYIPRFCYHEKLSIAANCRMCLVEVENAPKPLPACATPVSPGMKAFTRSEYAVSAQRATMEFLLINHPLDCPICDQGGECELQDLAMGFGRDISRFTERKRSVKDQNLGSLVSTDMTRCIHCTRCVRFGQEIAGIQELGTVGRSEYMEIGTFVERSVDHELSGNIIDLCPVGALNNKPYRFSARAWEMVQLPGIGAHDCVGSNLFAHVLRGELKRVVPRANEAINETWISDRDRFSYEGVYSDDRLESPMIKRDGEWQIIDWRDALEAAANELGRIAEESGAGQLGFLASPSATLEEFYLAQRVARHLGSTNLDHRLRRSDFRDQENDPLYPGLGMDIEALESVDAALMVGCNLRMEAPMLAHRIRKAATAGAAISFVNPERYEYLFPTAENLEADRHHIAEELGTLLVAVAKAAGASLPKHLKAVADSSKPGKSHQGLAKSLVEAEQGVVLLGNIAQRHPRFADLRSIAAAIADLSGIQLAYLSEGANAAGASLAGFLPHRGPGGATAANAGLNAHQMLADPRRGYLLLGVEPADFVHEERTAEALAAAEFCVALTPFASEALKTSCDLLLPVGTFAETSGTFVNAAGAWQSFSGVANPFGEARPAWKVLRVLANLIGLDNSEYLSSADIKAEIQAAAGEVDGEMRYTGKHEPTEPGDIAWPDELDVPIYAVDAVVRRATALQQTVHARAGRSGA